MIVNINSMYIQMQPLNDDLYNCPLPEVMIFSTVFDCEEFYLIT